MISFLMMSNTSNGFVVWFTGLPASGKTTLAGALSDVLRANGMKVEILDGDEVRQFVCQDGFDRASREQHLRYMGFLASRLEKNGIISLCAFVSPYQSSREAIRGVCKNFFEVYLSTPVSVCETRDPKGLYRKAREGGVSSFTGVSGVYEVPVSPDLILDTSQVSIPEAVDKIIGLIRLRTSQNYESSPKA